MQHDTIKDVVKIFLELWTRPYELFAYVYAHKKHRLKYSIYEKGLDLCNLLILKD